MAEKAWRLFEGLALGQWAGVCPKCGYLNVFGSERPVEPQCQECQRRRDHAAEQARQRRKKKLAEQYNRVRGQ